MTIVLHDVSSFLAKQSGGDADVSFSEAKRDPTGKVAVACSNPANGDQLPRLVAFVQGTLPLVWIAYYDTGFAYEGIALQSATGALFPILELVKGGAAERSKLSIWNTVFGEPSPQGAPCDDAVQRIMSDPRFSTYFSVPSPSDVELFEDVRQLDMTDELTKIVREYVMAPSVATSQLLVDYMKGVATAHATNLTRFINTWAPHSLDDGSWIYDGQAFAAPDSVFTYGPDSADFVVAQRLIDDPGKWSISAFFGERRIDNRPLEQQKWRQTLSTREVKERRQSIYNAGIYIPKNWYSFFRLKVNHVETSQPFYIEGVVRDTDAGWVPDQVGVLTSRPGQDMLPEAARVLMEMSEEWNKLKPAYESKKEMAWNEARAAVLKSWNWNVEKREFQSKTPPRPSQWWSSKSEPVPPELTEKDRFILTHTREEYMKKYGAELVGPEPDYSVAYARYLREHPLDTTASNQYPRLLLTNADNMNQQALDELNRSYNMQLAVLTTVTERPARFTTSVPYLSNT